MKNMILLGIKQMQDPYYQGFAAQLAFYFLLSIVPIMIVLTQILGLFDLSLALIMEDLSQAILASGADVTNLPDLSLLLSDSPKGVMNTFLVVLALWAGSRAQFSMARITNYTFSEGKTTGAYWKERFRAVKTMALTLIALVAVLVLLVYGEMLLRIAIDTLAETAGLPFEGQKALLLVRWPIGFAIYFLMVSYNYYVLPSKKVAYKKIMPGSLFAAVGMLLTTFLYSLAQERMFNYNMLYGSLASMVVLLVWFFLLAWILGLGIVCNKVFADTAGQK